MLLQCKDKGTGNIIRDDPSQVLLSSPVYSPIDSSIYYVDSGYDSLYYEEFRNSPRGGGLPTSQPGIYRVRLSSDTPAELVAADGLHPEISHDGTTLYYIDGSYGGNIWRKELPDGEPELLKTGGFTIVRYYSDDTLVVESFGRGAYWFDLDNDTLISTGLSGGQPDVSYDRKICHINLSTWPTSLGIYDSTGSWNIHPEGVETIYQPKWLANDREIICLAGMAGGGGSRQLIVDLDGNTRVPNYSEAWWPDFTPNGEYVVCILFLSPRSSWGATISDGMVWMMKASDGSERRQITTWSRIRPTDQ